MAEEPTLPQLPKGITSSKRARLHRSSSPVISSDPPLFSSDDDPSAENYSAHGRQKRRFRGPWYRQRLAGSVVAGEDGKKKTTRTFERNFDSAVFMGSDSTEADEDAEFSSNVHSPSFASNSYQVFPVRPAVNSRRLIGEPEQQSPEELADKYILQCMENFQENIDLSSRGLTVFPNHILRQLRYYVPAASVTDELNPNTYQSLTSKLKLFLSSNSLTRVPWEVCNLSNLTVLSFRNNQLVELPAGICKLQELHELNVANNRLQYLPFEILDLIADSGSLQSLQIHPNPFYEPSDFVLSPVAGTNLTIRPQAAPSTDSIPPELEITDKQKRWNASFKCRTFVRYLASDGRLLTGPTFPQDRSLFTSHQDTPNDESTSSVAVAPFDDIPNPPSALISRTLSLHEIAVRTWTATPGMPGLSNYLDYEAPAHLSRLLEDAVTLREQEGLERSCTVCNRAFIIPRTEWIEWWEITRPQYKNELASAASPLRNMENKRDQVERMIPLMRRGCSWLCVPRNDIVNGV